MHLKSTCCCCLPAPLGASVLLGSRLLWVPPHPLCASAFLSRLLWDSLCFVRDPAFLGPSPLIVCFTVPASLGQHFVLLGSRLLWVPPQPLCASAFLSRLLWDSLCFVRDPAFLGPSPLTVCFTVPASLGQHFVLLGSRLLWVPPHPLCASAFLSRLLWDSHCFVRDPAFLGPSPLIVCFTVRASLGQHFVLLGSRLLWVPPQPLCASAFLSRLLWDSLCFVRDPASLGPSPLFFCALLSRLLWDSFGGSWLIWVPSPLFSRCMVWVILMHRLTAWP